MHMEQNIHKNKLYTLVNNLSLHVRIIKACRIRHTSSHCAFFIACSINVNKTFKNILQVKGLTANFLWILLGLQDKQNSQN